MRTPLVILLSLLPLPIAFALDRFSKWLRIRFPRYGAFQTKQEQVFRIKPYHRILYSATFVFVYAVLFTQLYAFRVARQIRTGKGKTVRVWQTGTGDGAMIQGALIGTTSKYLFLWDSAHGATRILPVENISQVMIARGRAGFVDSAQTAVPANKPAPASTAPVRPPTTPP